MDLTDAEIAELYERYAHVLLHRCRRILRNEEDAQDAVQETFARVIRNAETFRKQSSPLTWMYTISTNHCLNVIRNRQTRRRKLDDHTADVAHALGAVATEREGTEDHARLLSMLEEADEQTRRCVIHTWFDDCTREETARLVGISVPTVRKRLNAFLERARRQLGAAAVPLVLLALCPWSWP